MFSRFQSLCVYSCWLYYKLAYLRIPMTTAVHTFAELARVVKTHHMLSVLISWNRKTQNMLVILWLFSKIILNFIELSRYFRTKRKNKLKKERILYISYLIILYFIGHHIIEEGICYINLHTVQRNNIDIIINGRYAFSLTNLWLLFYWRCYF